MMSHGSIYLSRASLSYRNPEWDTRQSGKTSVAKVRTPCDVARNTVDHHSTGAGTVFGAITGHHRRQNGVQKPPLRHYFGAKLPFVSRTSDLLPTDMAEVLSIISAVVRETKGFAQSLALFLCSATAWFFLGLCKSPLVSLESIGIVLWNCCLILRVSTSQLI